jgi:aryl-alcohol dehydrogenase-like predicted oxidoreductase
MLFTLLVNEALYPQNSFSYGLLWRGIEHEVVGLCEENGIAIMPWGPLQQGLLCGKFKTADEARDPQSDAVLQLHA